LLRLTLVGVLSASLSSCIFQFTDGHTSIGSGTNPDLISEASHLSASVPTAKCLDITTGYNCRYNIGGQDENSTINILAEGGPAAVIRRIFYDPLILEVPAGVISTTGTYDAGSGPQPLLISSAHSFPVQPGTRITAEVGTTFLFLDVPSDVTSGLPISNPAAGPVFTYTLSFVIEAPLGPPPPPVTVKPMLAGSLTVLWQTYYVPLLPCVNDFATIPAITIPQASTPQDLVPSLLDLIDNHGIGPCNHVTYDFTQATRPPGLVFLPFTRR
jgi:hypothetical protein